MSNKCICCGKPSKYSIQLAEGSQGDSRIALPRYYLPNEDARNPLHPATLKEVHFCPACMRPVEGAVRATILYLQAESGRLTAHAN